MKKDFSFLPCRAAAVYSTIFFMITGISLSHWTTMALCGQTRRHSPQPTHNSGSILAFLLSSLPNREMADWAQYPTQSPQPMHFLALTLGATFECWASLPLLEAEPMPTFLMAPPKPVSS